MSDRLRTLLGRPRALALLGGGVVLAVLPFYLEAFWLQAGLFAMAAAIGAIGLTLLVGVTGQLSLAHAFYIAVGAYGYSYLAGNESAGLNAVGGLGLPPVVAAAGAVALAGLAGTLFSPIAGRLRGIYLGIASLGLVFVGQHVLFNASAVTGGFNGRDVEPLSVPGFTFHNSDPALSVFGVEFGQLERLWYVGLVLVVVAAWFARNIVAGRPGRALEGVRDSEVAAAVMGVDVRRFRAAAFTVSSMYAGLAGVLLALVFERVVPDTFGLQMSIDYLVMIVIGGLGSVVGAIVGAALVSLLPQLLDHYSGSLPLIAEAGSDGLEPSHAARLIYGAAVVGILMFASGGLAAMRPSIQFLKRGSK